MLEFGDTVYYIDLDALDKSITVHDGDGKVIIEKEIKRTTNDKGDILVTETFERTIPQVKEVDAPKYDLLKTFIEFIMDYAEEADDALGADRALQNTSLGYKVVFNTLLHEGIIKEK